jgi:hypothetical protein
MINGSNQVRIVEILILAFKQQINKTMCKKVRLYEEKKVQGFKGAIIV